MSWSIGFDDHWNRDIGYGVPAFCDFPGCKAEIDRGLSYVCGSEPYGGAVGCGLYFCEKHRSHWRRNETGEMVLVCYRCSRNKDPFKPKPEHPDWLHHKATDPSWAEWRKTHRPPSTSCPDSGQPTPKTGDPSGSNEPNGGEIGILQTEPDDAASS